MIKEQDRALERLLKRVDSIEAQEVGAGDTGWIALPFATGWGDFSAVWASGEYRRRGTKVSIRGMVARSSGASLTIATLPAGYRPAKYERFLAGVNTGAATVTTLVDVYSTGAIQIQSLAGYTWVALSGIEIYTD